MESIHAAVEKFMQKLQSFFSFLLYQPLFLRLFTLNNRKREHLVAVITQTKLFFTLAVSPPEHFL